MDEKKIIKAYLENDQSRQIRDEIIGFVGDNPVRMKALMHFFMDEKIHWRYNQRAAWPLSFIGRRHPELIKPYLKEMVELLGNGKHDAVNRNILRIFEDIDIPEAYEGVLFDKCYHFLNHPEYSIAIRAFGLTVLFNIAIKYPETLPELKESILLHLPHGSTGFKNRANKLLVRIDKILKDIKDDHSSS